MTDLKFLNYRKNSSSSITINPEVLSFKMLPLAPGLPSSIMYSFTKRKIWRVLDLRRTFQNCEDDAFYGQLIEFINDNPDLVILRANNFTKLPDMYLEKNPRVSLKFCVYNFDISEES